MEALDTESVRRIADQLGSARARSRDQDDSAAIQGAADILNGLLAAQQAELKSVLKLDEGHEIAMRLSSPISFETGYRLVAWRSDEV